MKEKMFQKQENRRNNQGREITDYSAPLEQVKIEAKKLEELRNKITERLKFFEAEMSALELMKSEGSDASGKDIEKQYELLADLYREIRELQKQENIAEKILMERVDALLKCHDIFTNILENFNPDIEH